MKKSIRDKIIAVGAFLSYLNFSTRSPIIMFSCHGSKTAGQKEYFSFPGWNSKKYSCSQNLVTPAVTGGA